MKINFVWEDNYSVGNPEIDHQHKGLFDLANAIPEVLAEDDIKSIIMQFYKYTREHFAAEEAMMRQIDYPGIARHKELHEELITKLNDISSQEFHSDEGVYNFKKFVYDWLVEHIMYHDMDYFRFTQRLAKACL